MKRMRTLDDKIIYELNTTIPTDSFAKGVDISGRCQSLYGRLKKSYEVREKAIHKCIDESQIRVKELRTAKFATPDDPMVLKQLRKTQSDLRLFQSEVNIEEVVRDRSLKAFNERCRNAFKPPEMS